VKQDVMVHWRRFQGRRQIRQYSRRLSGRGENLYDLRFVRRGRLRGRRSRRQTINSAEMNAGGGNEGRDEMHSRAGPEQDGLVHIVLSKENN